jgi:cytochrome c biogenesis protein CcmG, thiol:disulfide interchange protein DsbE
MSPPQSFDTNAGSGRGLGCLAVGMTGTSMALLAILLLVVLGLYLFVQQINSRLEQRKGIGAKLPALELEPLAAGAPAVSLASLEGKVVLVNFWGTWCPPCRAELPEIAGLYHDLARESDFRLMAVSCGSGAEEKEALRGETQAFLKAQDLDLPVYFDPGRVTRKAFDQVAGLQGYPTTFLLDRQGAVRGIWVGYTPGLGVALRQRIAHLLAEKPGAPAGAPRQP